MGYSPSPELTLEELYEVLHAARYGVTVINQDDMQLTFVNEDATAILGRPANELVGQRLSELVDPVQAADTASGLDLLVGGALVSYKALRRFVWPGGSRDAWVWARSLDTASGEVVIAVIVPRDVGTAALLTSPLLPGDHLALGITDGQWSISRVSDDVRPLLGHRPADLRAHALFGLLHPDDAVSVMQAVAAWDDTSDSVLTVVRARHADGSWQLIQLLIAPLSDDDPPLLVFLMTEASGPQPAHQPTTRIAELERHLLRIAMEVQAADVAGHVSALPDPSRFPALRELSDRQWEVLTRLLAGERVPAIATRMHLSQSTVRNHLAALFEKFAVHSQSELLELLKAS